MVYLNCLAKNIENARDIAEASKGRALIGLFARDFTSPSAAASTINEWSRELDGCVSVGLGGGSPASAHAVDTVAGLVSVKHVNQVFPLSGRTKARVSPATLVNALVSPTGRTGFVKISTGPASDELPPAVVPVQTAVAMIKEAGADGVKLFNMKDLASDEEYVAVAREVARQGLVFEPTGGLGLDNIDKYLRLAKEAGVKSIIPHVYTSIIDKASGLTRVEDVAKIWRIIDKYYP